MVMFPVDFCWGFCLGCFGWLFVGVMSVCVCVVVLFVVFNLNANGEYFTLCFATEKGKNRVEH